MARVRRKKWQIEEEKRREERLNGEDLEMHRRRILDGLRVFIRETVRPAPLLTVSEWADKNRVLVSESSAEAGRWRTDRAPYQREIMNAMNDPAVTEIAVMSSAQNGKTEIELNMIGWAIDVDPGPILFVNPKGDFAEDFSKRRVAPMIKACATLAKKVSDVKSRDSSNTITLKTFPGGSVAFVGANSPTDLAGRPIRYLFLDEIDRYPASAGTEGDPIVLAQERTKTFTENRKIVKVSTPTIKGKSKIEKAYKAGTQEEWHTRCPHCGKYSFIQFDDIKFDKEEYTNDSDERDFLIRSIWWECPECGGKTNEFDTKKQPGEWVPRNEKAKATGVRSFRMNAFMSPWSNWADIARRFLRAKGDPETLQAIVNTELGELWEVKDGDGLPERLFDRRERYRAEVPDGVRVITMGVDTQDNRLEYEVVGWSQYEESWGLEKGIIPGRPDTAEVWQEIDALLDKQWMRADGMPMQIRGTFIDSGGHFTDVIYRECARRQVKRVWAIKGEAGESRFLCRPMKRDNGAGSGVRYIVGVDSGKTAIMYSAGEVWEPGPGYMHFPDQLERGYDIEYFKGLISEKLVTQRNHGRVTLKWEQIYKRNEPLDIRNYARAVYKYTTWNYPEIERSLGILPPKEPALPKETPEKRREKHLLSRGIVV